MIPDEINGVKIHRLFVPDGYTRATYENWRHLHRHFVTFSVDPDAKCREYFLSYLDAKGTVKFETAINDPYPSDNMIMTEVVRLAGLTTASGELIKCINIVTFEDHPFAVNILISECPLRLPGVSVI